MLLPIIDARILLDEYDRMLRDAARRCLMGEARAARRRAPFTAPGGRTWWPRRPLGARATVSPSAQDNFRFPRVGGAPILPLFSADEWLHLRFLRWLYESGRLPLQGTSSAVPSSALVVDYGGSQEGTHGDERRRHRGSSADRTRPSDSRRA